MAGIVSGIIDSLKKQINDLILPDEQILKMAIRDFLDESPYASQELDKAVGINNIPVINEILDMLETENLIQKAAFREQDAISKKVIETYLYYSNSFAEKVLKILERKKQTVCELAAELRLNTREGEYKTLVILEKMESEKKIELKDFTKYGKPESDK